MAEAARRTAVERFASAMIIPQYEKYYEEVIANGQLNGLHSWAFCAARLWAGPEAGHR